MTPKYKQWVPRPLTSQLPYKLSKNKLYKSPCDKT